MSGESWLLWMYFLLFSWCKRVFCVSFLCRKLVELKGFRDIEGKGYY